MLVHHSPLVFASFLGGLAIMATGCGFHQHTAAAQSQTLALSRSLSTIPAYLPSGQEVALNAATDPIAAVRYQNVTFLRQLGLAYDRVSAPKRPVLILVTDPGADQLPQAIHRVSQAMAQAHVTLPWALQIGPSTLYVGAQPTLLTGVSSRVVRRVVGPQAILTALSRVVALPKTPLVHPQSNPKNTTHKG